MKRTEILNAFIDKYEYKKYLEIGTQKNVNFSQINIEKAGVDPDPNAQATFTMTSDYFFDQLSEKIKFDIIFIDGLHISPQLYKDIINSLDHLSDNGTIVCHDCNPIKEIEQLVPAVTGRWNGDVWKDIVRLRQERDDLEIFTIDTDEGCCVIRKSNKVYRKLDIKNIDLTYTNFDIHRKEWVNLISVDKFITYLNK